MTPAQESAQDAAQIRGDCVRRAMVSAALNVGPGALVVADIVANDAARQAAGQTIEWQDEAKLLAGMIPGTTGLAHRFGRTIPAPVAPPAKNG